LAAPGKSAGGFSKVAQSRPECLASCIADAVFERAPRGVLDGGIRVLTQNHDADILGLRVPGSSDHRFR
jgi:hypothetical protein